MEALAALGVAAAVVQFVDFGSRLLTTSWDVYHDTTVRGQDLRNFSLVSDDLEHLISPIKEALNPASARTAPVEWKQELARLEHELYLLCVTCNEIARKLESALPKTMKILKQLAEEQGHVVLTGTRFLAAMEQHLQRGMIVKMKAELDELREKVMRLLLTFIWLTTRDIPQSLQAFSKKQDEMMALMQTKLNESQKFGPPLNIELDQILPPQQTLRAETIDYDFFDSALEQLFDKERAAEDFLFSSSSASEGNNFSPSIASRSVIRCLTFSYRENREDSISDPHANTYIWALEPPLLSTDGKPKWSDFPEWLASSAGDGAARPFWITGKPGSGKSTMLKFLANHGVTRAHLRSWAGACSLEVLSYYAWNPGAELSKSKDGLLRTFLHQLLTRHPNLASAICPRHWEYYFLTRNLNTVKSPPVATWVLEESFKRFLALEKHILNFRVAIFIDGLDEFQEAPQDFCDLVMQFARHPLIKICVASREWLEFNYAFESSPKLRVHDLTEDAIRDFVFSRFEDESVQRRVQRVRNVVPGGPDRIAKLIDEIVANASGVFLWVTLVTSLIITQLANHEPMDSVERLLRTMPKEMEGLYSTILDSIPAALQPSTAWTLLFYQARLEPVDTRSSVFYLADESRGSRLQFDPAHVLDGNLVLAEVEDRLSMRTRGILHQPRSGRHDLSEVHVQAVHRTAAEWLDQPRVVEKLQDIAGAIRLQTSCVWTFAFLIMYYHHSNLPVKAKTETIRLLCFGLVAHATRAEHKETRTIDLIEALVELTAYAGSSITEACLCMPMMTYMVYMFEKAPKDIMSDVLKTCLQVARMKTAKTAPYVGLASRQHLALLRLLLVEGLPKDYAELYVDGLFFEMGFEEGVTDQAFLDVMEHHFGSVRRVVLAKARKWGKAQGYLR